MERDNQAGRMLFTDFDASEKGRPDPAPPRDETTAFATLPDLDDLIASLDLDFEDDGEAPPESPEKFEEKNAGEPEESPPKPAAPSSSGDDNGDEVGGEVGGEDGILPPGAPAWSESARSRERNAPETAAALFFHAAARPDNFAPDSPKPSARPQPPPDGGGEYAFNEEAFLDAAGDGEMDVLSLLPPSEDNGRDESGEDAAYRPFEGEWRGYRLGLRPPRARPYGGVKRLDQWYRPPEDAGTPEAGSPERVADWFEPPERYDSHSVTRLVPHPDAAEAGSPEMAEGAERDEKEAALPGDFFDSSVRREDAPATSEADIFTGVDLEKIWRDKLERPAASSDRPGDSRSIDMFENMDLEAAWKERLRDVDSNRPGGERKGAESPESGDSTVVLSSGALDNQETLVMPSAGLDLPDLPEPEALARPRKSERRKRRKSSSVVISPTPDDGVLGFLSDLDDFFPDGPEGAAEPEPAKKRAGGLPSTLEELEIDDLVSGADEAAAESAAAGSVMREAAAEPSAALADKAETAAGAMAADAEEEDYIPSDDVGGGGGDAFVGVAGADAPAAERVPVTADDVIEQAAFGDGPAEDGTVEAPVVDDSIIASRVRSAGPDVEELLSIVEGVDVEKGEGVGADGGRTAVDPADVFSGLDDMDFSEDGDMLDDEVKAMLEEDALGEAMLASEGGVGDGGVHGSAGAVPAPPATRFGKAAHFVGVLAGRAAPGRFLERLKTLIAWRENWWFYCDLLAAIIASASLAVIFSYYFWYRE